MKPDEPNVVLPLAASYNTRGIAGFTNAVTNALDQRKVNAVYELYKNPLTGKDTLYVVKRPGVADVGSTYGTTGQVGYLWEVAAGAATNAAANRWVFSTSSNDVRASDASTTTVIVTAAGYAPAFVDKTAISGTDTVVIQLRNASGTQDVYYSSAIGTFTQISTSNFTNLAHQGKIEHLNGYAHVSTRNRIYSSDINTLATWPAINFLDRQAKQDIGTGLAKLGRQIVSFGTATMEIYDHVGGATGSPLAYTGAAFDYGLASTVVTGQRHYTAVVDGKLYWVGSNPSGVFCFNGQTVEKVSSLAVDKILAERQYYFVSNLGWQGQRVVSIGLDTPDASTQRALWFMPRWNDWFEFSSTVWIPQASPRLQSVCLGVGSNQHKLYAISESSDNWQDAGGNFTRTLQFQLPTNGNARNFMRWCGLKGTVERSACTETVTVSDDDGQNWVSLGTIDRTADKQHIYRCGSYRRRQMRFANSSNHEGRLEMFLARVD